MSSKFNSSCFINQIIKYFYENFVKRLETRIIDTVYDNSEKWFGGKRFTMNKILNCIVSLVEKVTKDDYRFTMSLGKDISVYDRCNNVINLYETQISESDNPEVVCI